MQTPNHDGLLTEWEASLKAGASVLMLRIECRMKRRLRAVGSINGNLLFDPKEIRRFKREVLPVIRAEQKARIAEGSLERIRKWSRSHSANSSGDSGDEDPARP